MHPNLATEKKRGQVLELLNWRGKNANSCDYDHLTFSDHERIRRGDIIRILLFFFAQIVSLRLKTIAWNSRVKPRVESRIWLGIKKNESLLKWGDPEITISKERKNWKWWDPFGLGVFSTIQVQCAFSKYTPLKTNMSPMVGRCIPYWNGHFLGDMLVLRGVNKTHFA